MWNYSLFCVAVVFVGIPCLYVQCCDSQICQLAHWLVVVYIHMNVVIDFSELPIGSTSTLCFLRAFLRFIVMSPSGRHQGEGGLVSVSVGLSACMPVSHNFPMFPQLYVNFSLSVSLTLSILVTSHCHSTSWASKSTRVPVGLGNSETMHVLHSLFEGSLLLSSAR